MPITIEELVGLSHLGCEMIAGRGGAAREATWAHVCELEDPVPWLEGGELVMTTGMAIPQDSHRQCTYLSRLATTGASALAISKDLRAPRLSEQFLQEADWLSFPILLVSIEVPFVAIARIVITANQDSAHRELVRQLSVFDALRAGGDGDEGELFLRLEQVSGYQLYLASSAGTPLLPQVRGFPEECRELLSRPSEAPAYVPGGYIVSVPIAGRVVGYLLGLRRPETEPGGLAALQHIATIAALQRATLEREREVDRREGGELLAELLKGRDAAEIAFRIAPPLREEAVSITLVRSADNESDSAALHHRLTDADCAHLMFTQQEIVLLAPAGAPLAELLSVLKGINAGRSRPFRFGESLAVAERQARIALNRAIEREDVLTDASSFAAELDWLPSDPTLTRGLTDRVLGPIMAQDKAAAARLLETLRVWLKCGQRAGEAARRLQVHPHTLSYRLARVERLTGRELSSPAFVAELWLALELLRDVTD